MGMIKVLYAFLSVAVLGGLLGVGLAIASKLLAVKKDKRISQVTDVLPQLNCGACGYAGCSGYAEAIVLEEETLTLCTPGGGPVAKGLAEIMGVEVEVSDEKKVAQVHCRGGRGTASYLFPYNGIQDCNALYLSYEGDKVCKFGCLGKGSCISVCPVDAIGYDRDGLVWVDKEKCISCGKCIDVCPTGVMKWIPYSAEYFVACSSTDKGALVRKYCTVGCIGCKMCEKKAPEAGFAVENFLASIDYSITGDRKPAVEACPPKCIIETVKSVIKEKEPVSQLEDAKD